MTSNSGITHTQVAVRRNGIFQSNEGIPFSKATIDAAPAVLSLGIAPRLIFHFGFPKPKWANFWGNFAFTSFCL
jgi:hypothetical protein